MLNIFLWNGAQGFCWINGLRGRRSQPRAVAMDNFNEAMDNSNDRRCGNDKSTTYISWNRRCRSLNSAILPLVNTTNKNFQLRCCKLENLFLTLFTIYNRWRRYFRGGNCDSCLLHHKVADMARFHIALLRVLCTGYEKNQQG